MSSKFYVSQRVVHTEHRWKRGTITAGRLIPGSHSDYNILWTVRWDSGDIYDFRGEDIYIEPLNVLDELAEELAKNRSDVGRSPGVARVKKDRPDSGLLLLDQGRPGHHNALSHRLSDASGARDDGAVHHINRSGD